MEEKIIKEIDKYVAEIDHLFEKDNPLSDLDRWCPKNGSIRAHIDSIAVSIDRMKSQLAEKEKEIETLKTQLRDNAQFLQDECSRNSKKINELYRKIDDEHHWYNHRDKRVESLEDAIEKAVIDIWNTKSIFGKWHSKTLEKIRKDLMTHLPTETQIKLCELRGFGPPNPRPKPPERKSVIIGYQPTGDNLDPGAPPQGGSGLK